MHTPVKEPPQKLAPEVTPTTHQGAGHLEATPPAQKGAAAQATPSPQPMTFSAMKRFFEAPQQNAPKNGKQLGMPAGADRIYRQLWLRIVGRSD